MSSPPTPLAPASATYAPFFQPFESIEAKDASTVTVKTKVPNFSLLKDRLAIIRVTPATQSEEDRAKQPIGSGPWMYDSYLRYRDHPGSQPRVQR